MGSINNNAYFRIRINHYCSTLDNYAHANNLNCKYKPKLLSGFYQNVFGLKTKLSSVHLYT